MISGTEPRRKASTGVPHAIASIIDQPERFRPIDRKQQRQRLAEKFALVPLVDLADEFDARPSSSGTICSRK